MMMQVVRGGEVGGRRGACVRVVGCHRHLTIDDAFLSARRRRGVILSPSGKGKKGSQARYCCVFGLKLHLHKRDRGIHTRAQWVIVLHALVSLF